MLRVDDLQMFGDRLLIDPDEKHAVSEGGLHIPPAVLKDNPNYYNMTGVVVRLGDGVMRHTFQCINCLVLAPQDEGPCPGCHQPLGNRNTRLFEAGDERYAFDVQVGDRVLFNRYAGKQVEIEIGAQSLSALHPAPTAPLVAHLQTLGVGDRSKRMLIMRESEVLGVVDGAHRIAPGYQAPKWNPVTEGLTQL